MDFSTIFCKSWCCIRAAILNMKHHECQVFINVLAVTSRGGGYSDLVKMGVCRLSLETLTHVKGHFGRKRYPFLRIFLEI